MLELVMLAIALPTAACSAFLYGRLRGYIVQTKADAEAIKALRAENAALLNRLVARDGTPPVFDQAGNIVIGAVDDSNPVMFTLRPPFAQAELDWEREAAERREPAVSDFITDQGIFIAGLSDEDKARLQAKYAQPNGNQ